jgi:hypothetical protein
MPTALRPMGRFTRPGPAQRPRARTRQGRAALATLADFIRCWVRLVPVLMFELARLALQAVDLHLAGQGARIVHRAQRDTKAFALDLYLGFDGGCPLAPFS